MIEIIYMDVDGTLRDEALGIFPKTVQALEKCREQGIRVVICTGRNPGSVQEDVLRLETDGIIAGGGCYIQYHGNVLKETFFQTHEIEKIQTLLDAYALSASFEGKQKIFMNSGAVKFYTKDLLEKADARKTAAMPSAERFPENKISYEDNFSDFNAASEKIHKVCLMGGRENVLAARQAAVPFSNIVQEKCWHGQWYLELLPSGCDKGSAVAYVNRYLAISKEHAMSFGDGGNDLDMFKETGIRIAVENAEQEILEAADFICAPPAGDGIYKELLRQGLLADAG